MAVTLANIDADVGELYDSVAGGTTAVTAIIQRSNNFVKLLTGTTTGYDAIIRPLADANVVNTMMGSIDAVNKTIGSLSVGNKDLRNMRDFFKAEANRAAIISGYSLDGLTLIFKDTESI